MSDTHHPADTGPHRYLDLIVEAAEDLTALIDYLRGPAGYECRACAGHGWFLHQALPNPFASPRRVECPACHGSGYCIMQMSLQ